MFLEMEILLLSMMIANHLKKPLQSHYKASTSGKNTLIMLIIGFIKIEMLKLIVNYGPMPMKSWFMDNLDNVLQKAAVIVTEKIEGSGKLIESQQPLVDDLVLSFFQLRNTDISKEETLHLKEIADYVDSVVKGDDRLDKLQVLRELRFKLGEPRLGMTRHEQVYEYVKLKQAAKKFTQQAQAMEE